MNKKYENPLFEVIEISESDVLCTSTDSTTNIEHTEVNDPVLPVEDEIL